MQNISFIGLGAMGKPMALNLLKNKYKLFLYDINKKNYESFKNTKSKIITNFNDLTDSDLFISMLPDGKSLSNLIFGKNGIINYIKKNSVFIDCSSVDYKTTIEVSKAFNKIEYLNEIFSGFKSRFKIIPNSASIAGFE